MHCNTFLISTASLSIILRVIETSRFPLTMPEIERNEIPGTEMSIDISRRVPLMVPDQTVLTHVLQRHTPEMSVKHV